MSDDQSLLSRRNALKCMAYGGAGTLFRSDPGNKFPSAEVFSPEPQLRRRTCRTINHCYRVATPSNAWPMAGPEPSSDLIPGINSPPPKSSLLNRNLGDGHVGRSITAIASQRPQMHGLWRGRNPLPI